MLGSQSLRFKSMILSCTSGETDRVYDNISICILSQFIAIVVTIRHASRVMFEIHNHMYACFDLFISFI